jgi:hypothetical protein
MSARTWSLAVAVLAVACGGGGGTVDAGTDAPPTDVVIPKDVPPDAAAPDDGREDSAPAEIPGADALPEVPGDAGDPCADPQKPQGCPCVSPDDCLSGLCIDSMDGLRCTITCQTADPCPRGWFCGVVANTGTDVVYGCIDPFSRLCQPCRNDVDCVPVLGAVGARYACLPYGVDGSFCGVSCQADGNCPEDFTCLEVGEGASATRQCVPDGGAACPCTDKFVQQGNLTECRKVNEFGTCKADRTCDQDCPAPVPAAETCNRNDDDCDGQVDNGVPPVACEVQTQFGICPGTTTCDNGQTVCIGQPPSEDVCDGLDNDCDGVTDPEGAKNCTEYTRDEDGDGRGVTGDVKCLCKPLAPYRGTSTGDCDDADPLAFPGAAERCNGKDDNCDTRVDEPGATGCTPYYYDADGDLYGVEDDTLCLCGPWNGYTARLKGDCNDNVPAVNPGAIEECNGRDDDCDGAVDEDGAKGCATYYVDADADTYGASDSSACKCQKGGLYTAERGGDCNDNNKKVNPSAVEVCNNIDDNCDGLLDATAAGYEDMLYCTIYWLDNDGDGAGDGYHFKCLCAPQGAYQVEAQQPVDCNDADNQQFPGATESCNGKDDDCDGTVDEEGAAGCNRYYYDFDADGFGDSVYHNSQCKCGGLPSGTWRATKDGDCNDNDALVKPGATERCDTAYDDNCNGLMSEENAYGCQWFMLDNDGDGYGVDGPQKCLCSGVAPYTGTNASGDCCDSDKNTHYGQSSFFTSPNKCGSFDYDCSGANDMQYRSTVKCSGTFGNCNTVPGWLGNVPDCGVQGTWSDNCSGFLGLGCEGDSSGNRTQGCR